MDNQKVEKVNTMICINPEPIPEPKTNLKKRKSSKNFFKVALFIVRGRSKKSKVPPVDVESRSIWRKLVGSMRPMHLQSNQSPPQINNEENEKMVITENSSNNDNIQSEEGFHSASEFANSPSPDLSSPTSSQYASTVALSEMANSPYHHVSSRYASAVGLSEMAKEEEKENKKEEEEPEQEEEEQQQQEDENEKEEEEKENENENENESNVVGDETIDTKADEFIAQFYQQMKLQRMSIEHRHYKEISNRSLGL